MKNLPTSEGGSAEADILPPSCIPDTSVTVMVAVLVAEVAEIKVKNKCVRERQKVFYMLVYCTEQLVLLPIMALILLVPIVLKAFRSPSDIGG